MTLANDVSATTGDVRQSSAADIDHTCFMVGANDLGDLHSFPTRRSSDLNDADTVAFSNTTSGAISYRDVDGFTVGTVASETLGQTVTRWEEQTSEVQAHGELV